MVYKLFICYRCMHPLIVRDIILSYYESVKQMLEKVQQINVSLFGFQFIMDFAVVMAMWLP